MPVSESNSVGNETAAERTPQEWTQQETIRQAIHDNAALTAPYLIMNALAAIVACYGLLENSVAVIIGAMLIALLMGPITGMALALVDGDQTLLREALAAEAGGAALVLLLSFIIGKVHAEMTLGSEILGRTTPNILDLIIALAGGAAGAYATISRRLSAGLVGVAIATALVPPLCSCGICVAHGLYRAGGGAFLLFFTNLVAIQSVTSFVFWLKRFPPPDPPEQENGAAPVRPFRIAADGAGRLPGSQFRGRAGAGAAAVGGRASAASGDREERGGQSGPAAR